MTKKKNKKRRDIGGARRLQVSSQDPAPTVMAGGIGSVNTSQYSDAVLAGVDQQNKPPYRVPTMTEIAAIEWNGYTAVSTFSGCGGSSLGYKMAGFRVLWANEFIPAAQDTYRANHPNTILDTRDIRTVTAQSILDAIQMQPGELDLFDGSPPCASFSTAGKREAGWGKVKQYSDTKQRTDDLFFEYARLLEGLKPKVFVAENVSGLVKGTAKGYFLEILAALKACGYRVSARVLDAQWLGVPQMRQRLIFIGVREDLGVDPVHPKPLPYRYSVRDALPHILNVSNLLPGKVPGMQSASLPSPTVTTGDTGGNGRHSVEAEVTIRQGNKNGHSSQRGEIDDFAAPAPTIIAGGGGGQFEIETNFVRVPIRAIHDTSGLFSQGDITDRPCPASNCGAGGMNSIHYQIEEMIVEPETDISHFAIGREWDTLAPGEKSDKYLSLVKPALDSPCNTITCPPNATFSPTAASSSGSVVHPTEKRKFSIAELKRICAFPDDFILTGTYAQQWERLGRAVPPVMMKMIAQTVRTEILDRLSLSS